MWGMQTKKEDDDDKMHVKKEEGQSGSAIFIKLEDGSHGIVDVHIGGPGGENIGVALNKEKMDWINKHVHIDKANGSLLLPSSLVKLCFIHILYDHLYFVYLLYFRGIIEYIIDIE